MELEATESASGRLICSRYAAVLGVGLHCIASYRYPMRIANGVLANGGDLAINVSGRVAPNGAVRVTLSHGDTRAAAAGRLSGSFGGGSWSGASCSGSWTAQRRSS